MHTYSHACMHTHEKDGTSRTNAAALGGFRRRLFARVVQDAEKGPAEIGADHSQMLEGPQDHGVGNAGVCQQACSP